MAIQSENKYYIYAHINPLKNEIFYIGKGQGRRAKSRQHRNKWWKNTVSKYGYSVDILEDNLTEEQALEREIWFIKKLGRKDLGLGNLVNLSDGGESGSSGASWNMTEEQKMKQSKAKLGELNPSFGKTSPRARKVIDSNGVIYESVNKAAEAYGLKRTTLNAMLTGQNKNNTNLNFK